MHIDLTTGDVLTPDKIEYGYKKEFSDGSINIFAYNLETILAEKFETIIRRGVFNTRPKDYYDIYILQEMERINKEIFIEATKRTAKNRDSLQIFNDIAEQVKSISESSNLKKHWERYRKSYYYAKEIEYEEVIKKLEQLSELFYS
jgi:predicted nucleotidyltransferase component of viral defense system